MISKDVMTAIGSDDQFGAPIRILNCPVCGDAHTHQREVKTIDSEDKYKAEWGGRGDLLVISFYCESGHEWDLCIGYHKGGNFVFVRTAENAGRIDYYQYIKSPEWKLKADAAKERAGHRCQVCNTGGNVKVLDAHHRTYERLGRELPEDITVLCRDCHGLFEKQKKASKGSAKQNASQEKVTTWESLMEELTLRRIARDQRP